MEPELDLVSGIALAARVGLFGSALLQALSSTSRTAHSLCEVLPRRVGSASLQALISTSSTAHSLCLEEHGSCSGLASCNWVWLLLASLPDSEPTSSRSRRPCMGYICPVLWLALGLDYLHIWWMTSVCCSVLNFCLCTCLDLRHLGPVRSITAPATTITRA